MSSLGYHHTAEARARIGAARTKSLQQRFWDNIEQTDDCWIWRAGLHKDGYGILRVGTRPSVLAHRYMWELTNGPIPEGMQVCHHCDNPPCVRPAHLFLGTQADNMRDCGEKGRNYWSNKTHCPQGHRYDEENTGGVGLRYCKACKRERARVWMAESRPSGLIDKS